MDHRCTGGAVSVWHEANIHDDVLTGPLRGEFTGHRWIPQKPVTRDFDIFVDLRLNKRLSKQWWGWWFETLSRSLWHLCNVLTHWLLVYEQHYNDVNHKSVMLSQILPTTVSPAVWANSSEHFKAPYNLSYRHYLRWDCKGILPFSNALVERHDVSIINRICFNPVQVAASFFNIIRSKFGK